MFPYIFQADTIGLINLLWLKQIKSANLSLNYFS